MILLDTNIVSELPVAWPNQKPAPKLEIYFDALNSNIHFALTGILGFSGQYCSIRSLCMH